MTDLPGRNARWGALISLVLVTAAAAAIGSLASVRSADFYYQLSRPSWAPPSNVFGPVWTVLYLAMAVAAWLMVRARGWPAARPLIVLYVAQLVFNAVWTWLFFRWHLGALAFIEILILWVLVAVMASAFGRVRPLAGLLLVPYLAWVTFAAALTYAIWQRNPAVL